MNYQRLELTTIGQVPTVKLNRPELFNAFNEATIGKLEDCVHSLDLIRRLWLADFTFRNPHSAFRISSPTR